MRVVSNTRLRLRYWRQRITLRRDFRRAKDRLLTSTELTSDEKGLLKKVSFQVDSADTMYKQDAYHYLSVGLSAIRSIREALRRNPTVDTVRRVLDFPSGYGRVLRFLRVMFPEADITAAEIESGALEFCRHSFKATSFQSRPNLNDLFLPQRFDLIWCGSLITHLDKEGAVKLLQFFHDHLSDHGVCVLSTHGQYSIDSLLSKKLSYGLTDEGQQKVIREVQSTGYGYAEYLNLPGYGISTVTHQRMTELANGAGSWKEIFFSAQGWDNHHDVYAFAR
jgi:SAM-dependent methyltransferase